MWYNHEIYHSLDTEWNKEFRGIWMFLFEKRVCHWVVSTSNFKQHIDNEVVF